MNMTIHVIWKFNKVIQRFQLNQDIANLLDFVIRVWLKTSVLKIEQFVLNKNYLSSRKFVLWEL